MESDPVADRMICPEQRPELLNARLECLGGSAIKHWDSVPAEQNRGRFGRQTNRPQGGFGRGSKIRGLFVGAHNVETRLGWPRSSRMIEASMTRRCPSRARATDRRPRQICGPRAHAAGASGGGTWVVPRRRGGQGNHRRGTRSGKIPRHRIGRDGADLRQPPRQLMPATTSSAGRARGPPKIIGLNDRRLDSDRRAGSLRSRRIWGAVQDATVMPGRFRAAPARPPCSRRRKVRLQVGASVSGSPECQKPV